MGPATSVLMGKRLVLFTILLLLSSCMWAQPKGTTRQNDTAKTAEQRRKDAFVRAAAVAGNLSTFQKTELIDATGALEDAIRQSLEITEHNPMPAMFVCSRGENGKPDECGFEWGSDALHAHYLMTEFKANVIWLRQSDKWRDVWLDPARSSWFEMRDIFCDGHPRWLYTDLDGVTRECGKEGPQNPRKPK